ncbi:acyltransferase family protein [Stackebrandtia nassauensis]|uniref:Acyltransferase 3 n=1 Tax=Stackebrandtia nassauensis (strain DSM 44728 / CIP 108903 / NRRL B-16338 / NBRC 102104 / LLR-40K-21) TaxID=446470 RepID=D3PXU5_STANL|nr:acyltransferase family protein [Stackebrandtia nassauensis]ADD43425.1 acyltransferase 3 [Stackebrandtia nassauensis DSM 44728]
MVSRSSVTGRSPATGGHHIGEIEGLRGIAIVLIVIYHVWFNRVSGGVDVFFLLSGFLITLSLWRGAERDGRVRPLAFYVRIVRRIVPPAFFVLVTVVAAAVVLLPQVRWRETFTDVVASALYLQNWHLAENAVDYLASQNAASPVRQYWSLAVQMQFYLLWPLLVAFALFLASRLRLRARWVLTPILAAVFAASLAYSIHFTATDPTYTYFDTSARLWEFALGGLAAVLLPLVRVPAAVGFVLGWPSLAALAACGMVFTRGDEFPGWASLVPTVAAATLVLTAGSTRRFGVDRLLRTAAMQWLGGLSYAIFLWHWPVLVFYLAHTGTDAPGLTGGLLVLGISLPLALGSKWLLEDGLRRSRIGQRTTVGGLALGAGCLVLVLVALTAWAGLMRPRQQPSDSADVDSYPGAAHLVKGGPLAEQPFIPDLVTVKDDWLPELSPDCYQDHEGTKAVSCRFGPETAERTIALVGGSHSWQWLPALRELAEPHEWNIVTLTKVGCRFTTEPQFMDGEAYTSCDHWNVDAMAELERLRPDAVVTTSTATARNEEYTPDGYLERWRELDEWGIDVIGVRDTPFPGFHVPECVERYGRDAPECTRAAGEFDYDKPAAVESRPDVPGNVSFVDLSRYFCAGGECRPVIGNVLVYRDDSHLTATYARTVAPYLSEALRATPPLTD